ncbi:MAG: hypothetical protein ACRD0M_06525 [Acidimicrobiales bacterium]
MSVGDILDGAFKLLKANAKVIMLIVAAITVPVQLISSFLLRDAFGPGLFAVLDDPSVAEAASDDGFASLPGIGIGLLLAVLVTPFIAGAVSRVVAASYLGREVSAGEALSAAFRRFGALLGSFVLVHLAEFSGVLACVVGLVFTLPFFMALFVATAPAIVVEELGPVMAMRRSWRLMRPRFWPVLGISLLAGFIANTIGQVLSVVPSIVAVVIGGDWGWLAAAVAGILSSLITAPIVAIVATLLYFDGRIRHEGFDLQIMASDLARGGAR